MSARKTASPPSSASPLTMAAWYKQTTGNNGAIMYFGNSSTGSNRLGLLSKPGTYLQLQIQDSGSSQPAQASTTPSAGVWNHACGVLYSSTQRAIFLNGGSKVTSTTVAVVPTINDLDIGILDLGGSGIVPFDGLIAELAIWNIALSDADVASLATGISPLLMHPEALVSYWPFYGIDSPEHDQMIAKNDLTLFNAPTQGTHPPIFRRHGI